jgi:hypothetical protein
MDLSKCLLSEQIPLKSILPKIFFKKVIPEISLPDNGSSRKLVVITEILSANGYRNPTSSKSY